MKPSDYLKRGWCQGTMARCCGTDCLPTKDADEWCLMGAIRASGVNLVDYELKLFDLIENTAVDWNDNPSRTQDEVIALAEKVEKELGI